MDKLQKLKAIRVNSKNFLLMNNILQTNQDFKKYTKIRSKQE